jgi:rubrerythrin
MSDETAMSESEIVAELNDLLQLDHDALSTYELALRGLRDPARRAQLEEFRADHRRHVDQLTQLLNARGATPSVMPHLPTAPFKLMVQALGMPGGDAAVLLAFKANERLARDKYARAARRHWGADIGAVIGAAAADEARHYGWAESELAALGHGEGAPGREVVAIFERIHTGVADAIETVQKELFRSLTRNRPP